MNFADHPDKGARYLAQLISDAPKDSFIWEYLHATGDKGYTIETFEKIAKAILEVENE
jgi:hypothetical protein